MMRVVHVSNDFEPLSGGISTHLRNILRAQSHHGIDASLIVPCSTQKRERSISIDQKYSTFRVVRVPYLEARTPVNKMIRLTQSVREGLAWLEKEGGLPDLIHQHDNRATRVGATLYARKRQIPLVWTNHSSRFFGSKNLTGRMITAIPGIHPDGLIVVHKIMEDSFRDAWPDCPVRYIPNGVDADFFSPGEKFKNGVTTVFFPQRMIPGKGAEELAEAAEILLNEPDAPPLQFRFAGSGEESNRDSETIRRVKNRLSKWTENGKVRLLGNLNYEEMPSEYQKADIVALPFKMGTESLSLYEAWASGTPVITIHLPETNKFVEQGKNCVILKNADPKKLAAAIREIAANPSAYRGMIQNGLVTARTKCSWNQRALRMKEFYEEILERHRN